MSERKLLAAGRWPPEEGEGYPESFEGPVVRRPSGDRDPVTYHADGAERCGWCDRPVSECLADPCPHYREDGPDGLAPSRPEE